MSLTIKLRGKTYSAPTIEAASDLFNAKQEIRGRIIREALVMDGSEVVARISQNGNVWPPQEWFPGMQPLIRVA